MRLLYHNTLNPWRDARAQFGPCGSGTAWMPSFDIVETDAAVLVSGDMPGLSRSAIEIRVEDGVLTVGGERKQPESSERVAVRERAHGRFERRFRLSDAVDADAIKASYVDGVLQIELPKRKLEESARLIPVN